MAEREISHYRLLEKVGEGGFGEVYRARDLNIDRIVAIKTLKPAVARDRSTQIRFLREAEAIASIDHPNVVILHEVIRQDDSLHLVMQWVQGETLRRHVARGGLTLEEAVRITGEIALGLSAAHEQGVVHRDLKPDNVLVAEDGRCKIVDFGLAHFHDRTTLARAGQAIGTLAYMAPEQRHGTEVDARADVYALGLILQELLGQCQSVPRRLRRLAERATQPRPQDRPASASEFLRELRPEHALPRWAGIAALLVAIVALGWPTLEPFVCGRDHDRVQRILVAPFQNTSQHTDLAWMSTAIMDNLIGSLGSLEGYRLVSRQTVGAALSGDLTVAAGIDDTRLLSVAQRVGVDYVVTGSYSPVGAGLRVNCVLQDFSQGDVLAAWPRDLREVDTEFIPTMDALGQAIRSALGVSEQQEPPAPVHHTETVAALRHFEEGMQHLLRADQPSAVESFRRAVAIDPTYARAYLFIWRHAPDQEEQREAIAQAMRYRHGTPPPLAEVIEAAHAEHQRAFDEAIALYESILASYPDEVLVRNSLASVFLRKRRWLDAIGELEAARASNPFDYSNYGYLVRAYVEAGFTEKARALLLAWRQEAPGDSSPLAMLVRFHWWTGDNEAALDYCDSLALARPGADLGLRATVLRYMGRGGEAEECLLRWMDQREGRYMKAMPLMMLADLDRVRGRLDSASQRIVTALQDQDNYFSRWVAGLISVERGELAAAEEHAAAIARAIGDDPSDSTTTEAYTERRFYLDLAGRIALARGETQEAIRWHDLASRASGRINAATFRTPLGNAYLAAGDTVQAIRAYQQSLVLNESYYEPWLRLGQVELARGDREAARRSVARLESVLAQADPGFPPHQELDSLRRRIEVDKGNGGR